jgi:hypothetical protein
MDCLATHFVASVEGKTLGGEMINPPNLDEKNKGNVILVHVLTIPDALKN